MATELNLELSTVSNRYRKAFELITGHAYSPDLWFRVFGPDKWSDRFADVIGDISLRRPQRSPVRRDVPDSVVTPGRASAGFVNMSSVVDGDMAMADLLMDVRSLIDAGRTDEQIRDELELPDIELVLWVRERVKEVRAPLA